MRPTNCRRSSIEATPNPQPISSRCTFLPAPVSRFSTSRQTRPHASQVGRARAHNAPAWQQHEARSCDDRDHSQVACPSIVVRAPSLTPKVLGHTGAASHQAFALNPPFLRRSPMIAIRTKQHETPSLRRSRNRLPWRLMCPASDRYRPNDAVSTLSPSAMRSAAGWVGCSRPIASRNRAARPPATTWP